MGDNYLNSPAHLRKLLDLYMLDLAMVKDGHRPASLAVKAWTRDMQLPEAQAFIEHRIGVIVMRLMLAAEKGKT